MTFVLPTHCLFCGAVLMGGRTRHRPGCAILKMLEECGASPDYVREMTDESGTHVVLDESAATALHVVLLTERYRRERLVELQRANGKTLIATEDECTCRTAGCGHRASSHIGGTCFECGREGCWR